MVSVRGGSYTHVFSLGSRTPSCSRPWVPLLKENALVWEPPLQQQNMSLLTIRRWDYVVIVSTKIRLQNNNKEIKNKGVIINFVPRSSKV